MPEDSRTVEVRGIVVSSERRLEHLWFSLPCSRAGLTLHIWMLHEQQEAIA